METTTVMDNLAPEDSSVCARRECWLVRRSKCRFPVPTQYSANLDDLEVHPVLISRGYA